MNKKKHMHALQFQKNNCVMLRLILVKGCLNFETFEEN
jgi:hypothetical protein